MVNRKVILWARKLNPDGMHLALFKSNTKNEHAASGIGLRKIWLGISEGGETKSIQNRADADTNFSVMIHHLVNCLYFLLESLSEATSV